MSPKASVWDLLPALLFLLAIEAEILLPSSPNETCSEKHPGCMTEQTPPPNPN